jgi:CRP/FNR family transcriptional regulator, cyclic AMP receptor protein
MHGTGYGDGEGFWHLLTATDRAALCAVGRPHTFAPGARICVEGEPSTNVFVLVDGWAKILFMTTDGHQLVLALRGEGDTVGELAGEIDGHRTATVQAIGEVRSLALTHDRFNGFLDSNSGADRAYRHMLTQRWNEANAMLISRATTNGEQRLAGLLIVLAERHGIAVPDGIDIEIPLTQEEYASLAGASRATGTRAFSAWRHRGFIRTGHRQITITELGVGGLRRIARR